MTNCGNIGIDCEYCENKNKCLIQDIYNQIKNHSWWDNITNQELWEDIRNNFWKLEKLVTETTPWKNKKEYREEVGYLYSDMYSLFFSEYCHDLRRYLCRRKVSENMEDIKQYFSEYLEIVEAYLNNEIPVLHCKTKDNLSFITTCKYYERVKPIAYGYYMVYKYPNSHKEHLLKTFKHYADNCKSEPLQKWGERSYNEVNENRSLIYVFTN